jgi:hypothetical protein
VATHPEADQCTDGGPDLLHLADRQLGRLEGGGVAVPVLGYHHGVDQPHDTGIGETGDLPRDVALELGVLEGDHHELKRSEIHAAS